jgi:hypothetical protein
MKVADLFISTELNGSRVKELGDLTSQIDLLTNSISENEWGSSNTTPVPSIPCSPRDEIPLKFDEPELPIEPLASSYAIICCAVLWILIFIALFTGHQTVAPVISD